ncbi:MAG: DUF2303 family protein [Alphaproteobacteria bacterium]|nr:DUF2303 family protein [Alphaproteobacteria bacterium]
MAAILNPITDEAKSLPAGAGEAALLRDVERLALAANARIIRDEETNVGYLIVGGHIERELAPLNPLLSDVIRERVTVLSAASFIDYGTQFRNSGSRLFVDMQAPEVTLDFDYHNDVGPGHRGHVLTWQMRTSLNWQRWTGIDGKPLTQRQFVEFLEENEIDVREPAGAALREILQAVEGTRNVSFTNATRLANGDIDLKWVEETEAKTKGGQTLPGSFTLGLPIFFGDREATAVKALLRYKVEGGKLSFTVILHRRQEIFEEAVQAEAAKAAATLGLTVLIGHVEDRSL